MQPHSTVGGSATARDGIADRLKRTISEVALETCSEVLGLEVMPDHVHVLCEVDPQVEIAKFARLVKGRSSHLLRLEFPQLRSHLAALWTSACFVSSIGGAPLSVITQYIEQQKNVYAGV